MNSAPEFPSVQKNGQIIDWPKIQAFVWIGLGLFLASCFLLPNYDMRLTQLNGFQTLRIVFKDHHDFSKLFDTASVFLMVSVPVSYLMLGFLSIIWGILLLLEKFKRMHLVMLLLIVIVLFLTFLGLFLIDQPNSMPAFAAKFMPKPTTGYFIAFGLQLIMLGFGAFTFWAKGKISLSFVEQEDEVVGS